MKNVSNRARARSSVSSERLAMEGEAGTKPHGWVSAGCHFKPLASLRCEQSVTKSAFAFVLINYSDSLFFLADSKTTFRERNFTLPPIFVKTHQQNKNKVSTYVLSCIIADIY